MLELSDLQCLTEINDACAFLMRSQIRQTLMPRRNSIVPENYFIDSHFRRLEEEDIMTCESCAGLRCFMYITMVQETSSNSKEHIYLFTRESSRMYRVENLHVPGTRTDCSTRTLLDGELALDNDGKLKYFMLDILLDEGANVTGCNLNERHKHLEKLFHLYSQYCAQNEKMASSFDLKIYMKIMEPPYVLI